MKRVHVACKKRERGYHPFGPEKDPVMVRRNDADRAHLSRRPDLLRPRLEPAVHVDSRQRPEAVGTGLAQAFPGRADRP